MDANALGFKEKMTSSSSMHSISHTTSLYGDLPVSGPGSALANPINIASKLGLPIPNLAPDVDFETSAPESMAPPSLPVPMPGAEEQGPKEPRKKKYAKEAWPGKKPVHGLLVWLRGMFVLF